MLRGEHVPPRSFTGHVLVTAGTCFESTAELTSTDPDGCFIGNLSGQDRSARTALKLFAIAFDDAEETDDPSDATATVG